VKRLRRHFRGGALFSVLLAATLFMRLLVPFGWMPVADAAGLRIELCPGQGVVPKPTPADHHAAHHAGHHGDAGHEKPDNRGKTHSNQPCAFSGLGMAFLDAAQPPIILPPIFASALPSRPPAIVAGTGLAAPPPHATGPPSRT